MLNSFCCLWYVLVQWYISLRKDFNVHFNTNECETDQERGFGDFTPLLCDALFLYLSISRFVSKPVKVY